MGQNSKEDDLKIHLCPIDKIPLEYLVRWQNDAELRRLTMGFRFPVQEASVKSWLESVAEKNGSDSVCFAIFRGEEPVGTCLLQDINWVHRSATLGIYVAERGHRGGGIGSSALRHLLRFAFLDINLHRVSLKVVSGNSAALTLYEKVGFIQEGVEEQAYFSDGEFHDVIRMSLISNRFSESI